MACRQLASSRSLALTWATLGFVNALPSEKTKVGTVWLPRLAFSTIAAASGCCSMSTTVKSMPSRTSCPLSRWQYPHHGVEYMVNVSGIEKLSLRASRLASL